MVKDCPQPKRMIDLKDVEEQEEENDEEDESGKANAQAKTPSQANLELISLRLT